MMGRGGTLSKSIAPPPPPPLFLPVYQLSPGLSRCASVCLENLARSDHVLIKRVHRVALNVPHLTGWGKLGGGANI